MQEPPFDIGLCHKTFYLVFDDRITNKIIRQVGAGYQNVNIGINAQKLLNTFSPPIPGMMRSIITSLMA